MRRAASLRKYPRALSTFQTKELLILSLFLFALIFVLSHLRFERTSSLSESRRPPLAANVLQTGTTAYVQIKQSESFLWMTPRTGGFNNQLITIYEAIRCAQIHNRTVVLPLIYENVRNDTSTTGFGPFPFEDYFDVEALSAVGRFVTPAQFDLIGVPCKRILFSTSTHFKANARRIPRLMKQNYGKRFQLELAYTEKMDPDTKEICVDDSLCSGSLFKHGDEFGLYSDYVNDGQGYSVRNSKRFKTIREAFKPSKIVAEIAETVLQGMPKAFNSMHIRRGDFDNKCQQLPKVCREFGENSFWQSREWILEKKANFSNPDLPLFVSTTHARQCREIFASTNTTLLLMDDASLPLRVAWTVARTDLISYASQFVASKGQEFVGNRFSSYTTSINYMRLAEDPSEPLRFF